MASYENPSTNPYQAPQSSVAGGNLGRPAAFTGYAGFGQRFVAYIVDAILVGLLSGVIGFVLGMIGGAAGLQTAMIGIIAQIVGIVIAVAYYAGLESSDKQATLGKQMMGIKVTDLSGRRISFGQGVGRFFGKIVSALILFIGFIMAAFTAKKQGLHDMMAGTLVMSSR